MICKRAKLDKNYGVVLVPEGLIEFIPEIKTLIGEINEILSKEHNPETIKDFVLHHLTYQSKALFTFLPRVIQD